MKNFALIGAAGYIAPRHMKAIQATGNRLVAAVDPHDSVGILDQYFPDAAFFTEFERFDRHLEKLRRRDSDARVHYVSICSPNYLHDAHVRAALRLHAHAICEKPLVIKPWNLDYLRELEQESGYRVYTVLQLRQNPTVIALRDRLRDVSKLDVTLTYITRRGRWYDISWKGNVEKSGGLAMNIGVHFFDLLMWLLGPMEYQELHLNSPDRMAGYMELERARVRWYLSVSAEDLPPEVRSIGGFAHRVLTIDDEEIDLSSNFTDLHTLVYNDILNGGGFGIDDARPSISLVHAIRIADIVTKHTSVHPLLKA